MVNLDEVAKTGKDEATDAHKEDKKKQFFVTVLQSISNGLGTIFHNKHKNVKYLYGT